jgi:hypothetical protein
MKHLFIFWVKYGIYHKVITNYSFIKNHQMRTFRCLLFVFFAFTIWQSNAQEIPNADMENWVKYGLYEDPQHWKTPNAQTSILSVFTVEKEVNTVYAGNYSARLESKPILGGMAVIPGFMTNGDFDVNTTTMSYTLFGGVPFTKRPLRLKGFNQYFPVEGDMWLIVVTLFRYDTVNAKTDTIGMGLLESGEKDSVWTAFEAYINYSSQDDPDSMNIIILSSGNETPPEGSVLYIDSLWFDYTPSSVEPIQDENSFQVYPNPVSNELFIEFNDPGERYIRLLDVSGKTLYKKSCESERYILDVTNETKGLYFLQIREKDQYFTRKIIIQ